MRSAGEAAFAANASSFAIAPIITHAAPNAYQRLRFMARLRPAGVSFLGLGSAKLYNGRLLCFFAGVVSVFDRSISNAWITFVRVSRGSMTSSTYPRAAATYGFANRSA